MKVDILNLTGFSLKLVVCLQFWRFPH